MAEAAHYARLPAATLRSWFAGRAYPRVTGGRGHSAPVLQPADRERRLLSFNNLIEAHVLRALRSEHAVSLRDVRTALSYAERTLGIRRLLLHQELRASGGKLFLDRYGELLNLSAAGQIAMRKVFEAHLARVEWDRWQFPVRLFPFVTPPGVDGERTIAIDPSVGFGRPIVARRGIATRVLVDRIDAGESLAEVARDYGLKVAEVEAAIVYERAA